MCATVRIATADDLDGLLALDARAFAVPWTREHYAAELQKSFTTVEMCANGDAIVAASVSWVLEGEAHILRVVTDPDRRRRGLARDLLRRVIERAKRAGCSRVLLEVGAANVAARALYAQAGFGVLAVRKGYYRAPPDDAIVMELLLGDREPA